MSYLQLITTLTSISLHLQCTGGDIIQKGSHYNFKNNSCVEKKKQFVMRFSKINFEKKYQNNFIFKSSLKTFENVLFRN